MNGCSQDPQASSSEGMGAHSGQAPVWQSQCGDSSDRRIDGGTSYSSFVPSRHDSKNIATVMSYKNDPASRRICDALISCSAHKKLPMVRPDLTRPWSTSWSAPPQSGRAPRERGRL